MYITLKMARLRAGLTLSQAAKDVGTSASTLSSWETNKAAPRIDKLEELCKLYGITLMDLDIRRIGGIPGKRKKMPTHKQR